MKNGSFAVNKGDNSKFAGLDENTKDLAGNPRRYQDDIDLGAYESQFDIVTEIIEASDYFKVLSNPTMDIYKLISSKIIEIAELRDLNGKLINKSSVNETETIIDLRSLSTGVYIVSAKFGEKMRVVKVLKR